MSSSSKNEPDINRPSPSSDASWFRADSSGSRPKPIEPPPAANSAFPSIPGYQIVGTYSRSESRFVYHARHLGSDRFVALTLVADPQPQSAERLELFKVNYEKLKHANILHLVEASTWEGQLLLAFEYIDGSDLSRWLRRTPPSPHQAAAIIERLARAAHFAHGQGIVHGHLAPANIMLAVGVGSTVLARPPLNEAQRQSHVPREMLKPLSIPLGDPTNAADDTLTVPKIADFGFAELLSDAATNSVLDGATELHYLAPEQWRDSESIAPSADIYALGVILYEMLTGRPPFIGTTEPELQLLVQSQPPVPPRLFRPWLSPQLETICLTCLHKDPKRRYRTAEDLANELERFLAGKSIKTWPPEWRGRVARLAAIAVLIASTAILGVWAVCK